MKIRSITYFDNLQWPFDLERLQQAVEFIAIARSRFQAGGFEVQTTRVATPPFPLILGDKMAQEAVNFAEAFEERLISAGFNYASIGPALPEFPESYEILSEILANTRSVFVAGIISSCETGIDPRAIKLCASVIKRNSVISADGFDNLRFAALANVPSGSPFLPAAYQKIDEKPAFAIATEAADLAVKAIKEAKNLESARTNLINNIEAQASALTKLGNELTASYGIQFAGIDFSFAPYPLAEQSIGTAIEQMGVPALGQNGSLAAVAILAEALDQARYPRVGFNGVMLPLLEDTVLAQRGKEEMLTLNDLLLYSTVCGTGLDTIPLPGEVSEEQIFAILLDLAALTQRLGKPLTARLMPIPGKSSGDMTDFDFEFFANSKVLNLKAQPLTGLLTGDEPYKLKSKVIEQRDKDG
jgi:uncharacterized protein (UPF0210 family)